MSYDDYFCASSVVQSSLGATNLCVGVDAGGIISTATSCPSTASGGGVTPSDPKPYVDAVAISDKLTIVITLVIKVASTGNGNNQVKLFVDLLGVDTPTDDDKKDLCTILKTTLVGLDIKVPADKLVCHLDMKSTVKRDVNYVATMSYPSEDSMNGSSSTLIASFAAGALASVAAFF
jgi:hypothetical protein